LCSCFLPSLRVGIPGEAETENHTLFGDETEYLQRWIMCEIGFTGVGYPRKGAERT
jgi:hypothetical protein